MEDGKNPRSDVSFIPLSTNLLISSSPSSVSTNLSILSSHQLVLKESSTSGGVSGGSGGSKLFIGGLSYNTNDQQLKEAFNSFGEVTDRRVYSFYILFIGCNGFVYYCF
ncbi:hypothetical protein C5167_029320 [Papaver somniferum]|nr:hypothetical protein C5167_029320 [Papaver somniferum]